MKKIILSAILLLTFAQFNLFAARENAGKADGVIMAGKYELSQNYPNPFNPETTVKFTIEKDGFVTLKLFNIIGQEVKTVVAEVMSSGAHEVTVNGKDLKSGVYFYTITAGSFSQTKRMILVK